MSIRSRIQFVHSLQPARDYQDRPEFEQLCDWWRASHVGLCALTGLGDAVVSGERGIVQYDMVKKTAKLTEVRFSPRPPSAELLEAVRLLKVAELRGERPWEGRLTALLKSLRWRRPSAKSDILLATHNTTQQVEHPTDRERRGTKPRVFRGTIASANILLKEPVKRDWLRDQFGAKAVEMEGSGIADATWTHERGYLVVRGICDYCDSKKGDAWQRYAAAVAAAYTRPAGVYAGKSGP